MKRKQLMKHATAVVLLAVVALLCLSRRGDSDSLTVLSDSQLWQEVRQAHQKNDVPWLAMCLYAYAQRDPEPFKTDAPHRRSVLDAIATCQSELKQAINALEEKRRAAAVVRVGDGISRTQRGLTVQVPPVADPALDASAPDPTADGILASFAGSYSGRKDGREARLKIDLIPGKPARLRITLTDLERKETYEATYSPGPRKAPYAHILRDVKLDRLDRKGQVHLKLVLLHTWKRDYITTVTTWGGRDYGGFFSRDDIAR